jgi:hypothetical protein
VKQSALERSVARATGESVTRIRNMGFSLLRLPDRFVLTGDSFRASAPENCSKAVAAQPRVRV